MGRGSRPRERWKNDRQRKKKAREKKRAAEKMSYAGIRLAARRSSLGSGDDATFTTDIGRPSSSTSSPTDGGSPSRS
jgi:hypothetical protein